MRVQGGSRGTNKVAREEIKLREDGILFQDDDSGICENGYILKLKQI